MRASRPSSTPRSPPRCARGSWACPRGASAGLCGSRTRPLIAVLAAVAAVAVVAVALLERRPSQQERAVAPPGADARPLFGGTLQPDVRYGTLALQPALTFEVADGRWLALSTESADLLQLVRVEPRPDSGQRPPSRAWLSLGRMTEVYDPAERGLERSLSPGPADPARWLRAHPDIQAGPSRPARARRARGRGPRPALPLRPAGPRRRGVRAARAATARP